MRRSVWILVFCGCGTSGGLADASLDARSVDAGADGGAANSPFVVATINTGTTLGLGHDNPPDDGYSMAMATVSDAHYGDGLAWPPAIEAMRAFLAREQPDIVAFQEIFHPEECASIDPQYHAGFVCETWQSGDPTVAQTVLGAGYQVACNLGKPDKCVGVRRAFGTIRGCATDLCLDFLDGATITGCGGGSRIGRARIDRTDGTTLTVVAIHGSSGIAQSDQDCRIRQLTRAFELADGTANVLLGDLNTDPVRLAPLDASARFLAAQTAPGMRFQFVTATASSAPPTYGQYASIDHVLSDTYVGSCWAAGLSPEHPPVIEATYFDHRPIVCTLRAP